MTFDVFIDSNKIRKFCIEYRYYTCGTDEEYSALLDYVNKRFSLTADDVAYIARDIEAHSFEAPDATEIARQILDKATIYVHELEQEWQEKVDKEWEANHGN